MRVIKFVVLLSALLLAATLLLEEVLQMYQKNMLRDNPKALTLLEDEANKGNINAAFLLATAYKNGKLGDVDIKKSIHWYKVAAHHQDPDAMLMIGWMYYKEPTNLEANLKKARYWFKKAASHGVEEAIEMLELLHR